MRRIAFLALLAGVVAFGACTSEEDDDDDGTSTGTGTGTGTGTPAGTSAGTAAGSGTGTGAGTATGGGGQGGEGGASAHPQCASVDGVCTDVRWELCPTGWEPVHPDPNQDCPGEGQGTQGWCCVDAPASTCSDDSAGNCIVGTTCEGCWGPVHGYACEYGRVCCQDICD